ncbi:hypothetical protein BDQ12DRAFT_710389 [Crucibulum laeve]|uniref:Homeobox domain-containing protein n=1 Tax=Crucibulum laeve TaxID=68775 RepID=A0A5C3MB06_9AGAR|nr:hypothetical protein BDQ12DRAFT_710389 [Crucibulum laeve]
MASAPPTLSRTSSTTSISSGDETVSTSTVNASSRRTRKRFTNAQLTMLENLFHQNSHPSREDRENVAKAGGMEIKSVTIWFQNKRQTERKASSNGNSVSANRAMPRRMSSPTFPSGLSNSSSSSSRPSLDHVASRTELRNHAPRTPNRRQNPTAAIWDNMPSSPLGPPVSPPAREYVEFPKSRRTLEWACAAARLADKEGIIPSKSHGGHQHRRHQHQSRGRTKERSRGDDQMDMDVTDDELEEAITPTSTWGREDPRWTVEPGGAYRASNLFPKGVEDDDMMKAALALCGLGRRS